MRFQDFIDQQKARRSSIDIQLAKSLVSMSDSHGDTIKILDINEITASTIMTTYYEALREIVEAIAAKMGYKIYSHEALTYFLKEELGKETVAGKFDRFRKIRNNINYYGKQIDKASAENNIREIEKTIKELKQSFLKGL